jgi:hypothetical protein
VKFFLFLLIFSQSISAKELQYSPAPPDNPLKGLVPYASEWKRERFPHSMEFRYLPMDKLMTSWDQFDWTVLEMELEASKARGKQSIFRIFLEYPGRDPAVPKFLVDEGVKITEWICEGKKVHTPDYESPKLRKAIAQFIAVLGKKYDGDPRIGFITTGMLGLWGEWHTHPRNDLWASRKVQQEVMEAFDRAFNKTHLLLRYPAGKDHYRYADNRESGFGYHDDSFAWATVGTGKPDEDWFFHRSLVSADLEEKWKHYPIGGEIRPEIWKTTFTGKKFGQQEDFDLCIEKTHVSWLMDSGVFLNNIPLSAERKSRAIEAVQKMGYELHLKEAHLEGNILTLKIENRGVAPFYHDWPIELRYSARNLGTQPITLKEKLTAVFPGKITEWKVELGTAPSQIQLRIPNPMKGGLPLRFANKEQGEDWLTVNF